MTAQHWDFDPVHSSVNFWVRHLMVSKVHGRFHDWKGTLELDDADPTKSRIEVEIDAKSIDTRDEKRDTHLRSPDFLDVDNHPSLRFKSTSIEAKGDDRLLVRGDLTIRGISRPVTLDVEVGGRAKDPWGGERTGFSATAAIDRKEYGLQWNMALETGGVLVGDKVNITIEVEAVKQAAKATG
jgi:polyisoprenoid-binding protein YceI